MSANENKFVPIRVSTLRGQLEINFSAYIRVNDKYILYCRKGDSFASDRIQKLKEKKLRKLFIKESEEEFYRSYIVESIQQAYSNTDMEIEFRSSVIQGAQQAAAEEVMEQPENESLYVEAKNGAQKYVDFLMSEDDALKSILDIKNSDNSISHHGVNVATLSVEIARKLNLAEKLPLQLLVTGCLIHDYDHYHSGIDMTHPLESLDPSVRSIYELHPISGAEHLIKYSHFEKEVIDIVVQHEELINGTGFPRKLKANSITPMAQICAVANVYDRLVTFRGQEPKSAIKTLFLDKLGLYPLQHLEALRDVLKERGITT